jgi:ABC-type nitrate/sulfonate/bicarbonate transport system substrate-binding protein
VAAPLDRRQFLGRGLVAGAGLVVVGGGASSLLAACSSDKKSTTSTGTTVASGGGTPADLGTLDYQLSWIKNVEFAGAYIADTDGLYTAQGFSKVNLLSGGPNVTQDAVVDSGGAFVGISAPDITASGIVNNGNKLIAVAALFQKNPFCVMSLATNPLPDPQSMIGKKIGVQSVNEPVWTAFLKANEIDPSSITLVPAQFNPQPLADGEVDGWFSFVTNEPNLLKEQGIDTVNFLLNDYKYPLVSQIYIVQTDTLTKERDKLKAFLTAEIKGWHAALKDPARGANLAVTKYGADQGLTESEQVLESKAQNALILDERTKTDGIMTVTQDQIDENIATLALSGIDIEGSKLFDLSVLAEVYDENPDLKAFTP